MNRIVKNEKPCYDTLEAYIRKLKSAYPSVRVATCGKSAEGREIYALVMGKGDRRIVYAGGTHAQEWLTSLLLMRFCEDALSGKEYMGYTLNDLLERVTLIVIPEINPDGIEIALKGLSACRKYRKTIFDICNGDLSEWNANARGVDINHNFNADWYNLRDYEEERGISSPSPRRYGGQYPESEPETRAITRFLRNVSVDMLISFHSQGEEIYYEYGKNTPEKSLGIARIFASLTDYTLVKNEGHCAGGGLKDWFIEEIKKPAFTVEIGKGKNPLPLDAADEIYEKIIPILVMGLVL